MPEIRIDGGEADLDEPCELSLSTNATSDELWARWLSLGESVEQAGREMTEAGQRWKDTTDPTARDRLWVAYEAQAREYRVLAAWQELFYTAFIFCTDGAYCAALDSST